MGNGTATAAYRDNGDMVDVFIRIVWGSTTSLTGAWRISVPLTIHSNQGSTFLMCARYNDSGSYFVPGGVTLSSTDVIVCNFFVNAGSMGQDWLFNKDANATTPWTWTTNDNITLNFSYRKN